MKNYGIELILDLHGCDPKKFNRSDINKYWKKLCEKIDMEKCEFFFWDDEGLPPEECQTEPHLKGTSGIQKGKHKMCRGGIQFIMTSNITIHTLDIMKKVFINIYSCKDFDKEIAEKFSTEWFGGYIKKSTLVDRV